MLARDYFYKHIYSNIDGYDYIGATQVFIPYFKIGIEVLERTTTPISFIHETILKYLETGINSEKDLQIWLGLDKEVVADVISDMAVYTRTVHTSQGKVTLTSAGRIALNTLQSIEKRKFQLNDVFINGISSEITEMPKNKFVDRVPQSFMSISPVLEVDMNYLNSRFEQIKKIYESQRRHFDINTNSSLFRLLEIVYEEIKFIPFVARIYRHRENCNILIIFPNNEDYDYASIVHYQIQHNMYNTNNFFVRNYGYYQHLLRPQWIDTDDIQNRDKLIEAYHLFESDNGKKIDFEEAYYKDRYLLSGETEDLLSSIDQLHSSELVMLGTHIDRYLENNLIISVWISLLDVMTFSFYISATEKPAQNNQLINRINHIYRQIPPEKRRRMRFYQISDNSDRTIISCLPEFSISVVYDYIPYSRDKIILKELAAVRFGLSSSNYWFRAIKEYAEQNIVGELVKV